MRTFLHVLLALSIAASAAWSAPAEPVPVPVGPRGVPVLGRVIWPGHDLSNAQVRVYADAERTKLVDAFPSGGASGALLLALNPGKYYLMAFVDLDGDGTPSPGDGIGFYGVTDVDSRPRPFVVDAGSDALTVLVPIAFRIAADGKSLEPVPVRLPAPYAAERDTPISGRVTGGTSLGNERLVLLIPLAAHSPPRAAFVRADGTFALEAVPGSYYLIAIENLGPADAIGRGDLIGVTHYEPAMGSSLPTLRAGEGDTLEDIVLRFDWALAGDGRLRSGDGSVLGPRLNLGGMPAVVAGVVTRFGEPVPGVHVRAYADEDLRELHYSTTTDDAGRFCLGVRPLSYYLVAMRDVNGDGTTGPGDELGFFGIDHERLSARPEPLALGPGELHLQGNIPLVMVVDDNSVPVPLTAPAGPEHTAPETVAPTDTE